MKFQRDELRHESLTVTGRKVAAFTRKQAREADALPLFSEQIREEQHDWMTSCSAASAFVVGQRSLMARFWRQGRAAYFALPEDIRAACKAEWDAWRGPHTPTNLIYIVEKFYGVGEARSSKMCAEIRASNARIEQRFLAQPALV